MKTRAYSLLVFFYPRDWRIGEVVWTPMPERVLAVRQKYVSASRVTATEVSTLRKHILSEDICMIHLEAGAPEDDLMACQRTQHGNFFSRKGVTKLSGAIRAAKVFGFELGDSLAAGDSEMDNFLAGAGLAVIVGTRRFPYRGLAGTIRVANPPEFGSLLGRLQALLKMRVP